MLAIDHRRKWQASDLSMKGDKKKSCRNKKRKREEENSHFLKIWLGFLTCLPLYPDLAPDKVTRVELCSAVVSVYIAWVSQETERCIQARAVTDNCYSVKLEN